MSETTTPNNNGINALPPTSETLTLLEETSFFVVEAVQAIQSCHSVFI